ncbi:hypothetical protein MMC09_005217 [Bachmanniomyces sp. S44760]|nr:hypothetical protein [Bachmanniomyces sp. S44760]
MSSSTSPYPRHPTIPLSIATVSILPASTSLPSKLHAIARAGFNGLELGFPDLLSYAQGTVTTEDEEDEEGSKNEDKDKHDEPKDKKEIGPYNYTHLCTAATAIKILAQQLNLTIMLLQPFSNFEGWAPGSSKRDDAFRRARGWIRIMAALDCTTLQVGSSDSDPADFPNEPILDFSTERVVADLRELAEMVARGVKGGKIAYENWCWSSHAPDWKSIYSIVQAVGRENVGLCLDTFQSVGGEYADPTTSSGLIEGTSSSPSSLSLSFSKSCTSLSQTLPPRSIHLLQISDAYKPSPSPIPNQKDEKTGLRPRAQWSSHLRPLPYQGGYLGEQIEIFTAAVLRTGFGGWVSVEVFDGEGGEKKVKDVNEWTLRARKSVGRLLKVCGIQDVDVGVN